MEENMEKEMISLIYNALTARGLDFLIMNVGAILCNDVKEKANYVDEVDTVLLVHKDGEKINKKHGIFTRDKATIFVGERSSFWILTKN